MDFPALSVKIVGSVLLFFAIKSGVKHVRDDIQLPAGGKNSKPQGLAGTLTLIETAMDRCAGFVLKYTGILPFMHFVNFVYSYVEAFLMFIFGSLVKPLLTFTGIIFVSRSVKNAASNLAQDESSNEKEPEKPPSTFSVIAEKALNKLLLYLWITFMFAFSMGMIVNN
jgi:hypothetical protein